METEDLESEVQNAPLPGRPSKVKEWIYRYGPAEVVATLAAYASFFVVQDATDNRIAAAYAGSIGEGIAFYGAMLFQETVRDIRLARHEGRSYGVIDAVKTAGKLAAEFGPAEALDSFLIRPATMGFASKWLGRQAGIAAGKMAADVAFYIPTIISYELRKGLLDRHTQD